MQDNSPVDDVEVSSMLNWVFCIRCLRDCKDEVGFYASSMCHHFVCTNCLFAVGCECKKCNISTEYFEIELNVWFSSFNSLLSSAFNRNSKVQQRSSMRH